MNTANTSVNQIPAIYSLVKKKFGWKEFSVNLDYGAGKYHTLKNILEPKDSVYCFQYDKYNKESCKSSWKETKNRTNYLGLYNTCTISNVLNVCPTLKERIGIIKKCLTVTKKSGRIYITTYEGNNSGVGCKTTKGWQNNQPTSFYYDELKKVFDNVERYGKLIVVTKE